MFSPVDICFNGCYIHRQPHIYWSYGPKEIKRKNGEFPVVFVGV
jgi:hypothetical protein